MLAELHGKLENHMEDELTGNVFGTLRYTAFNKILKPLLKVCIRPKEIAAVIDKINCEFFGDKIKFWSYDKMGELDLLMTFDEVIIGVEVKFLSELSGDDQLEREAEIVERKAYDREKILLFLAPESTCLEIVTADYRKKILDEYGVQLCYIAWEDFLDALKILGNDAALNPYEKIIVDDLIKLLTLKEFARFRTFNLGDVAEISVDEYFNFGKENFMTAKTDENIVNAAAVIRKTHENVQKFLEHCKNLTKKEITTYELLTKDFLRFNSDRNFYGFMYGSFTLLFKRNDDIKNIVYGIEVSVVESHVKVMKYFYNDAFDFQARISPSDIGNYNDPLWKFENVTEGDYTKIELPLDVQDKYQKLSKIIYRAIPLSEITADNVKEKIFDTFDKLSAL